MALSNQDIRLTFVCNVNIFLLKYIQNIINIVINEMIINKFK